MPNTWQLLGGGSGVHGGGDRLHHRQEGDLHWAHGRQDQGQDRQARGQLPEPSPTRHQAVLPYLAAQGPGAQLHHQLENLDEGKLLQPLVRHVPTVHEGKIPHHVLPGHCHAQPEGGGVLQLQTPTGKAT